MTETSSMATQLYLFRHGETAWSLTGQHTGRTDLALTANGERRARHLGERLRGITFAHVLTSPLQRARRTGELAGFGAVMQVEPDLREWDYGDYEGRTSAEIHAQQPEWNLFEEGCPGGESVEQVSLRVDQMLARFGSMVGTVAVFSHGHFLRSLAACWIGLPVQVARHLVLDTGSLSLLGYEPGNDKIPVISRWNEGSNMIGAPAGPPTGDNTTGDAP